MGRNLRSVLFGLALALLPCAVEGQNHVTNGGFDDDLADWIFTPGEMVYSTLDAGDDPASGSALMPGPAGLAFQGPPTIFGATAYDFGARIRRDSATGAGQAVVFVYWFDSTCTFITSSFTPVLPSSSGPYGVWIPVYARVTSPQNAGGCGAQVGIASEGTNPPTYFDGVVLALAGSFPLTLFAHGFESGTTSGWNAVVP